jgi:uncharacterized Zn finger protein
MSEKPLQLWIIAEKDGRTLAAHCTCMAGLGEACTHVAAEIRKLLQTKNRIDSFQHQ